MTTDAAIPPAAMPRSARGMQTRSRLTGVAIDVLCTRGVAATSLREIASAAEVSHSGLLRHFPDKRSLVRAALEDLDRQLAAVVETSGTASALDLLRASTRIRGYHEIFTEVAGEPADSPYGVQDLVLARAELWQRIFTRSSAASGDETLRILSIWQGLQVMSRFLPDRVKPMEAFIGFWEGGQDEDTAARTPGKARTPQESREAIPPRPAPPPMLGYAVGRERRAKIVDAAVSLFANEGYVAASMNAIAERLGLSKSGLFHHFPAKEDLLQEVLTARDRETWELGSGLESLPRGGWLRHAPVAAAASNVKNAPGLIEAYCALSAEAAPKDHPAHRHFVDRYGQELDVFTQLFHDAADDGELATGRDPDLEAILFVALWDGLQFAWLSRRSDVDVAAELASHLERVLPGQDPDTPPAHFGSLSS